MLDQSQTRSVGTRPPTLPKSVPHESPHRLRALCLTGEALRAAGNIDGLPKTHVFPIVGKLLSAIEARNIRFALAFAGYPHLPSKSIHLTKISEVAHEHSWPSVRTSCERTLGLFVPLLFESQSGTLACNGAVFSDCSERIVRHSEKGMGRWQDYSPQVGLRPVIVRSSPGARLVP